MLRGPLTDSPPLSVALLSPTHLNQASLNAVGVGVGTERLSPMRYEPSQRLLRLALTLAATRSGLTLDEMAQELEVKRRTVERLRDSLAELFPQLESWDDDARMRRWRLPGGALAGVAEPRAEAVAAVEALARECAIRGETDRAGLLRDASTTLRALMRPAALLRAEPDIAALMEGEGIAMRPGPRPKLDPALLPTLRRAILGVQLVAVRYAREGDEAPVTRILCPYGTLYGGDGRAWLVGHVEDLPDMRLWRLDRIVSVDLLDRSFVRRADFDLAFANGNVTGYNCRTDVWAHAIERGTPDDVPAYWRALYREPSFQAAWGCRYRALRAGPLAQPTFDARIDAWVAFTASARARDQARWPTIGQAVFPNCSTEPSYDADVAALRAWIAARLLWLDGQADAMAPSCP